MTSPTLKSLLGAYTQLVGSGNGPGASGVRVVALAVGPGVPLAGPISAGKEVARTCGMKSLREDGLAKARQGTTTIEELLRVLTQEV